jgi:creatinine amidohydrolase
MALPRRRWTEMTTEDFRDPDVGSWIAVLPVAAVEQHGPHLPLGVDALIGAAYLAAAEPLIPDDLPVTVLPMQAVGTSVEHEAFPGTLSLSPETVVRAWIEIGEAVARTGVRKLVLINSHGGNSAALELVARALRARFRMLAVTASWSRFGYPDGLFSPEEIRHGIHGGAIETSLMLAVHPELVRRDKVRAFPSAAAEMERGYAWLRPDRPAGFGWMAQDLNPEGALGDATAATAEAGRAALAHGARAFVELLDDVRRFPLDRLRPGPAGA